MLGRFAAIAARSWTSSCGLCVCTSNISLPLFSRCFAYEATSREDPVSPKLFAKIVRKRVSAAQQTLRIPPPVRISPSSQHEIEVWGDALKVSDFGAAVEICGERLLSAPIWVLVYLLSNKVHTPSQAMLAVPIMLQHFPAVDRALRPGLIILVIRFLAKQQVPLPIPSLIKLFLATDLPDPTTEFNLLLRAMSHFKPSPIPSKATVRIIEAMHGRQIMLQSRTYRSLLSNSLVTLELAKKLQQSMVMEGVQPNRHHLEAYLRVFAHHGAVHSSARYLNLIREETKKEEGMIVPHGVELSSQGPRAVKSENSANTRWNTEFLMSFKRHTGSAFQYLRDMVDKEDSATVFLRPVRKESRVSRTVRKDRPRVWKHRTHVSDWATVLNVAAHDRKISSERLLKLFDDTRAAAGYPPTVGIFTVLMRGLARKGDYAMAMSVWERCRASWTRRRKLDTKALTVAMDIIVASGQHLSAFDTLVKTSGILHDRKSMPQNQSSSTISRRCKRALYSKYAKVDVPLVNSLMNAYQKNGRQDLVFMLWDVFYPLFGVHPNSDTLTIVLDAALSVALWDRTFRGLLEQLGLHDLFSKSTPSSFSAENKKREQIVQHVQKAIQRGSPSSSSSSAVSSSSGNDGEGSTEKEVVKQARKYMRRTLWNGELAAPKAIKLFQEIVLGNYPELRRIVPPAKAVWPDEAFDASPLRDALSSLGSRLRGGTSSQQNSAASTPGSPSPKPPLLFGPSLLPSRSPTNPDPPSPPPSKTNNPILNLHISPHPQITPNSQSFSSYLLLLGRTHRASQIPLTLAWMRYLHVRPLSRPLAIALALWSEASMRGPLIQAYGARESEFDKLYMWLVDWLGKEGVPSEAAVSWAFRKLKQERES
ncbi:hypothetical protein ACEPAI_2088 [Sanghuangporus weigelae]